MGCVDDVETFASDVVVAFAARQVDFAVMADDLAVDDAQRRVRTSVADPLGDPADESQPDRTVGQRRDLRSVEIEGRRERRRFVTRSGCVECVVVAAEDAVWQHEEFDAAFVSVRDDRRDAGEIEVDVASEVGADRTDHGHRRSGRCDQSAKITTT